ncbi:sensor histidine kinase [Actinoplanes sp. NPDC051513]|uniref:sensor histidine kinase n=1 Tax=Actinoplanes sp. NPDC051513 TaxID=3363908 RepID=UPI0037BC795D
MPQFPARRPWAVILNLVGVALVASDLAQRSLRDAPVPLAVAAWVAWSLWQVVVLCPERWVRVRTALYLGMIAGGSLAGVTTDVVAFIPAAVALLALAGAPIVPVRLVGAAVAGSIVLVGIGLLIEPAQRGSVIGVVSLLLLCGIGGLSRRQHRVSEAQSRALLEERLAVEQERAQVAALTERSRIARDLHDVLAHSLGGLVIQLEAVDALLESGQPDQARDRVRAARKLAVSGLNGAKQAVTALREPDEALSTVVAALADTHRALGGEVAVRGDADRGALDPASRKAVRRAVQELLTNARRHAPGAATTLDLDWDDTMLTVTATTPAGHSPRGTSPGGGHGCPAWTAPARRPASWPRSRARRCWF